MATSRLVRITAFALWLISGLLLAVLAHRLVLKMTANPMPKIEITESSTTGPESSALARLFGASDSARQQLTNDRVRVVGLMAGAQGGVVSITLDNGPVRQLSLGQADSDGLLFQGVIDQQIVISRGGETIRIPVSTPKVGLPLASPR